MNKLNNRLLTVFLLLGIVVFCSVLYMMIKDAVGSNEITHSIQVDHITIVKNDFADTARAGLYRARPMETSHTGEECSFSFTDVNDSIVYFKSAPTDIVLATTPSTDVFYERTSIPQATIGDSYKISLTCGNYSKTTFAPFKFYEVLALDKKEDNLTEHRDIKLTSIDKKLTIILSIVLD